MSELAEGARLEIVYAPKGYLGFESPSLRQNTQRPELHSCSSGLFAQNPTNARFFRPNSAYRRIDATDGAISSMAAADAPSPSCFTPTSRENTFIATAMFASGKSYEVVCTSG